MAKEKTKTAPTSDESLAALRERVTAILHSNGFEGTKTAGEIVDAVSEFTGAKTPVSE
jgi:hypothetical protein